MAIREYSFNVPGFIPGIPGMWSAGQCVTVDEETNTILTITSMAVPVGEEQQEKDGTFVAPLTAENSAAEQSADPAQQLSEAVKQL